MIESKELETHSYSPASVASNAGGTRPHIVMVVPRGEAVRNFLYSDTLRRLSEEASVTLISVVDDEDFITRFSPLTEQIIKLKQYPQPKIARYVRAVTENAHDRWLWSAVARNYWELRDKRAAEEGKTLQRSVIKLLARALATKPSLLLLTEIEQYVNWKLRATTEFDELFKRIKPDLVFNCSHIHGLSGELPLRVAQRMGIPTVGFIFSWDNLTSRSRIFVPYDYYLVWHGHMREQLLSIYPKLKPENVFVTGTPQFDFHYDPKFSLSREELCQRIGIDPTRPYVLYTSGIWNHFYEEHRHVELVIRLLSEINLSPKPQLVVRTYAKGTSNELKALAAKKIPGVFFPPTMWNEKWLMPLYEDLSLYSSLLQHTSMGINAASTVSLELMMLDKPVINIDFDPPGTNLPAAIGYSRHINFDHYRPVADSGGVMVARSESDMKDMLLNGLKYPDSVREKRSSFIQKMFAGTLGSAGKRVAEHLLLLASNKKASKR